MGRYDTSLAMSDVAHSGHKIAQVVRSNAHAHTKLEGTLVVAITATVAHQ